MGKLRMYLPPYAPDYSGVCSALFELGGLVVIHDGGGCTGNYTGYDEPRWYGSKSAVFCSGLREMDAVMGMDDRLIGKIKNACEDISAKFVAVLGSPAPMLIGSDMKGIAAELESQMGIPCFGMDTSGIGLYNKGIGMAEMALAKRFMQPPSVKIANGVNILGMTPLDFSLNSNAEDLKELLKNWGYEIIAPFHMGNTIEKIAEAPKASVNLVVSEGGMELAAWMEKTYQVPYVAGLAMGSLGVECLQSALQETLADGQSRVLGGKSQGNSVLFIGEQIQGNAWRAAFEKENGIADVQIGCLFGKNPKLAATNDINLSDEEDVIEILKNGNYTTVVADPLFEQLIPADKNIRFVKFPHISVSSKIYWDQGVVFADVCTASFK